MKGKNFVSRMFGGATAFALTLLMLGFSATPAYAGAVTDGALKAEKEAAQRVKESGNELLANDPELYGNIGANTGGRAILKSGAFPEKYDLRNVNGKSYVTSVKFQNPWGTCWGFASIAAAETSMLCELAKSGVDISADQVDLSELHLTWFARTALPEDDEHYPSQAGEGGTTTTSSLSDKLNGGNIFYATSLFSSGIGPAPESMAPYKGKNGVKVPDNAADGEKWYYSPNDEWGVDEEYRFAQSLELQESNILPAPAQISVENGQIKYTFNPEGVAAIKKQLMDGKAVTTAFFADTSMPGQADDDEQYISENYSHYTYEYVGVNHGVTIVGWDDTYAKENFDAGGEDKLPPDDGAWIVKNSWGAWNNDAPHKNDWGVDEDGDGKGDGYFYLSYYDQTMATMIETFDFYTEDFGNTDKEYYLLNQYDLLPSTGPSTSIIDGNAVKDKDGNSLVSSTANVFKTEIDDVYIRALTTETAYQNTSVNFKVYLLNENYQHPEDGELLTEIDKTYTYGGYHRVDLDKSIPIPKNSSYSVVVTQTLGQFSFVSVERNTSSKEFAEGNGLRSYFVGVVNEGESYYKDLDDEGNVTWFDLVELIDVFESQVQGGGYSATYDNFPIKAYTSPAQTPSLELTQEIVEPKESYNEGDVITYRVTVKNTGYFSTRNIELTSSIADLGDNAKQELMYEGSSKDTVTFEYTYTVTADDVAAGKVDNKLTLTVSGSDFFKPIEVTTSAVVSKPAGAPDDNKNDENADDEDKNEIQTKTVINKGITKVDDGLLATEFNTPEKVVAELERILVEKGFAKENSVVYDIELQISTDGGNTWAKATEENFPKDGITVFIPYEEGVNGKTHDFSVIHMYTMTSEKLGTVAGNTEAPEIKEDKEGIYVTFKGLSPVIVGWKEAEGGVINNFVENVKTGDSSSIMLLGAVMIMSLSAVCATLVIKKYRHYKNM